VIGWLLSALTVIWAIETIVLLKWYLNDRKAK
jgi:hypothetical protein